MHSSAGVLSPEPLSDLKAVDARSKVCGLCLLLASDVRLYQSSERTLKTCTVCPERAHRHTHTYSHVHASTRHTFAHTHMRALLRTKHHTDDLTSRILLLERILESCRPTSDLIDLDTHCSPEMGRDLPTVAQQRIGHRGT